MSRPFVLTLYFAGIFLQAGTYGLTFMLPKLFGSFGANEKDVGLMLMITAITTLFSVYYAGHITDRLGRMVTLGLSGFSIAAALFLFGRATTVDLSLITASALLGIGWSLFYTLGPVVLTRIIGPDQRVRYFSLLSVFMMAGFGLSPVAAAVMETAGFAVSDAFSVMAVLCLASGTLFILLRTPVRQLSAHMPQEARSGLSLSILWRIVNARARLPVIMACIGASVFAGMSNFQTVFADTEGLEYADYFLAYTVTVIICRILLAGFSGGPAPYRIIAALQYVMVASVVLFVFVNGNPFLYVLSAVLFGIGYGASYPVLTAMAANDAESDLVPQTLQLFALMYFIGIFGFPLLAGWAIVEHGVLSLLIGVAVLAFMEATMAAYRYLGDRRRAAQTARAQTDH